MNIDDVDQYRRPAPARQAQAAQGHVRLYRGRGRGRARAGAQRRRVPQAPTAAALSRRRVDARPDADDFRPHLFEPVRHFADRRRRSVPAARRRIAAGRGGARRQHPLHHVGRQQRLDGGSGQGRAGQHLVSDVRREGRCGHRRAGRPGARQRARRAGADRRRAGASPARAQSAQRLRQCPQGRCFRGAEAEAGDHHRGAEPPAVGLRLRQERRRADPRQLGAACRQRRDDPARSSISGAR